MLVTIHNGKNYAYDSRKKLREHGFRFGRAKPRDIEFAWYKDCEESEIAEIAKLCKQNGLKGIVHDPRTKRSINYRQLFFKYNSGLGEHRKHYQCVYCGRILRPRDVEVDHIIPVAKAQSIVTYQKCMELLNRQGIDDVNDIRNLVPACKRCNRHKSHRMGLWRVAAKIGRHHGFWATVQTMILFLVISFVVALIYAFITTA